jgi:hypothetical protein
MYVYRVEDADKRGPYRNWSNCPVRNVETKQTPTPQSDGLDNAHELRDYRYGFKSKNALRAWFDERDRRLRGLP